MTVQADFTRHDMPSGETCWYKDTDHSYWQSCGPKKKSEPDGEWGGSGRLTGVTTIVSPFDWESGALMGWAVKINIQGIAELFRRECLGGYEPGDPAEDIPALIDAAEWLRDPERIKERLRAASLTDEDVRDAKGDIGTNVHLHTLNALAAGQATPSYGELVLEERPYADGVVQFWLDHHPHASQAEQVVCDLGMGVAGRFDFRGTIHRCGNKRCACQQIDQGATVMLDLKTGGYIGPTGHVQVAGYDHQARVCGFGPSDAHLILKVDEEGNYTLIRGRASREDFLTAIEVYRRAAAIRKAANADRKRLEG